MKHRAHLFRTGASAALLAVSISAFNSAVAAPNTGDLEVIAELPMRPGNVTPAPGNRVFATVHPLDAPNAAQLIEITDRTHFKAWPNTELQRGTAQASDEKIDSPLGIVVDGKNRLWITDMGLNLGKTRLWAFDVANGKQLYRIALPEAVAPKGSFVQDLAVDDTAGWIYLADIASPGLIAVEIASGKARRFGGHPALQAEADAKMVIGGKAIQFQGKPASVAVNPLSLSADRSTLFFGAMNGRTWYSVPTRLLRDGASDEQIGAAIKRVGAKPISDGAATDAQGRHFFTNVTDGGIDVLNTDGTLKPLVRDARLDWPDSVHTSDNGWLYISVNQLYKTPAFSGAQDGGKPPYLVMRVWPGK